MKVSESGTGGNIRMIMSSECANGNHSGCLHDARHMPSTGAHLVCDCECHDTQRKPASDKGTKAAPR